jgi:putative transposase
MAVPDLQVPTGLPGLIPQLRRRSCHCARFFPWYNHDQRHSGIRLLTPADVHYARPRRSELNVVWSSSTPTSSTLDAYVEHPRRFVRKSPILPAIATIAWISEPENEARRLTQSTNNLSNKV